MPAVPNPPASFPATDEAPAETDTPTGAGPAGAGPAGRIDTDGILPGADVDRPGTDVAVRHSDAPAALPDMMRLAAELAEADILPRHLRRRPANVLALMFAARALDIPIWVAFQSLHLIDGRVGMDATFQRSLVVRAGHRFRVLERTDQRAVVEIVRHDDPVPRVTEFSWADARAAGLAEKDNWRHYRKAMLMARVTTTAIRDHCPEVLFGAAYTPEELGMDGLGMDDLAVGGDGTPVTLIASERVHDAPDTGNTDNPDVTTTGGERGAALRAEYQLRINLAATPDDLNGIWLDAKTAGVLAAPLDADGTVEQALWARSDELRAVAEARAALTAQGIDVLDVETDEASALEA